MYTPGSSTFLVSVNTPFEISNPNNCFILLDINLLNHKINKANPKIDKPINYETGADIQALYVYLGKGWSPYEAHKSFLYVFKTANNEPNHKRYKIIKDFIEKYDKGEVSNVKR